MTDILFVAATAPELEFTEGFGTQLVTGPGLLATSYHLTAALRERPYRLAINLGICGSLDPSIVPGDVVVVDADQLADFGAEDGDIFLPASEIGLLNPAGFPYSNGLLRPFIPDQIQTIATLQRRHGISVQKVHGSSHSVAEAFRRFGPVVESMEGAAFFYCCMQERIPCLQIRAVSNMVERRNRDTWQIDKALQSLKNVASKLIRELEALPDNSFSK